MKKILMNESFISFDSFKVRYLPFQGLCHNDLYFEFSLISAQVFSLWQL